MMNTVPDFLYVNDPKYPEQLYKSLLENVKYLYYKSNLLERSGIIHYDNEQYQKDLQYIEYELLSVIVGKSDNYDIIDFKIPGLSLYHGRYKLIQFHDKCNIIELHVLLQETNKGSESATILIGEDDIQNGLYIQDGCKSILVTIIVKYTRDWLETYRLGGIIEHELKHLFDQNKKFKNSLSHMNKDIILRNKEFIPYIHNQADKFNKKIDISIADIFLLQDINTSYKLKYKKDIWIIYPFFADMLYYLNESEISARLVQIKWADEIEDTRNLYSQFYNLCNNILNYAESNVKRFMCILMVKFNFDKLYNIKIKKSENDIDKNVETILQFFMKRINHFIKQCDKIIYSKTLKESSHYYMISDFNIQVDYDLIKEKYNYLYPTLKY